MRFSSFTLLNLSLSYSWTVPSISISRVGRVGTTTELPRVFDDTFCQCWQSTSSQVNPDKDPRIDKILQRLVSPAPQSYFVIHRAIQQQQLEQRGEGCNVLLANTLGKLSYLLKPGYQYALVARNNSQSTDAYDWMIVAVNNKKSMENDENGEYDELLSIVPKPQSTFSARQLAQQALKLVEEAHNQQVPVNETKLQGIFTTIQERLEITLGTDIRGRTSSDTAFLLALAGCSNENIFDTLTLIAKLELERIGGRQCRSKDVLHVVEKLAASGVRNERADQVYRIAAHILQTSQENKYASTLFNDSLFGLLSARPLLWLWRYSSRLRKATLIASSGTAPQRLKPDHDWEWIDMFEDPHRPLVVDVGCGFGVSLLGLATQTSRLDTKLLPGYARTTCNFLGADLSELACRFGRGIAHRWNLTQLHFVCMSADELLQVVATYPGPVALVLIQFPTPYLLLDKQECNSQLPTSLESGFMVTKSVMRKIADVLRPHRGKFLFQSNCEDVSVRLLEDAVQMNFTAVEMEHSVLAPPDDNNLPQRTREWIKIGGKRAVGKEWSSMPLLPSRCATETEVACEIKGVPVHRFVVEPSV